MSSDITIKVKNLSKCYQIYEQPKDRLKQMVLPKIRRMLGRENKQYYREFWALKNVSFEVKKGETVGVIGTNGSGKSTLLQMICGTLTPTSGDVLTNGRIAALLELGSGFNPEFTGRENVYMNGALLGLSRDEIDNKFDDIVSFSGIGEFINQPVKTYSSGMAVRLAFAVQSQIDPDILIVDEALSVGDAKFQAKCFERLRQLKERGTSILLVTHSSEQIVNHCTTALLLNSGVQIELGEPRHVINRYMDVLFGKEKKLRELDKNEATVNSSTPVNKKLYELNHHEDVFSTKPGYNAHEYRWGDGTVSILDYFLSADQEPFPSAITSGQTIFLVVAIHFHTELINPILGITVKTKEGVAVYGVNSESLGSDAFTSLGQRSSTVEAIAEFRCSLAPGDYFISLGIATRNGEEIIPHDRRYDAIHFQVRPDSRFFGLVDLSLDLNTNVVK